MYRGLAYFGESPRAKVKRSGSASDPKFRLNQYKYAKNNPMFVKPANKEEIQQTMKSSVIVSRLTNPDKTYGFGSGTSNVATPLSRSSYSRPMTAHQPEKSHKRNPSLSNLNVETQNTRPDQRETSRADIHWKSTNSSPNNLKVSSSNPELRRSMEYIPNGSNLVPSQKAVSDGKKEVGNKLFEKRLTLDSLRRQEFNLKYNHKIPHDIERTNLLIKQISVSFQLFV